MKALTLPELKDGLRAIVGITVTPFASNGTIDETAYAALVRRCVEGGINVLTPNGNTSEFYSLTPPERRKAVEITRQAAPDAIIVAGVGGDVSTAAEEAAYFREIGVDCVMVHEPVHPFWSNEGWVEYHRNLASAVPGFGIVPYIRNSKVDKNAISRLLADVPEVIAVKYAIADPVAFADVVADVPDNRVTWICGLAEMWAPFFSPSGAAGFTSGLVSVDPARSVRMFQALSSGDLEGAMQEQREIAEFENLRARNSSEFNVTTVKEALAQLNLCLRNVRAPLSTLGSTDRESVSRILESWGLSHQTVQERELV